MMSKNRQGGRPRGHSLPHHLYAVIYFEDKELVDEVFNFARREGDSVSDVIKTALKEFLHLHFDGNPQIPLKLTVKASDEYLAELLTRRFTQLLSRPKLEDFRWIKDVQKNLVKAEGLMGVKEKLDVMVRETLELLKTRGGSV